MKNYLIFATRGYRVFQFFLIPLAAVATEAFVLFLAAGSGGMGVTGGARAAGVMAAALFLVCANGMSDYWAFCGVAAKGADMPVYLKTSARGRMLLRSALASQMKWTFAEAVLVLGGSAAVTGLITESADGLLWERPWQEQVFYLDMILAEYVAVEALNLCTRHFTSRSYFGGVLLIGTVLGGAACWLAGWAPFLTLPGLLALAAAVSWFGVRRVMQRMEESYDDAEI